MIYSSKQAKSRSGVTVVETAVVLSAALFFMFGIFEWGRFVMVRQVMENSAREGARYAVVHTGDSPAPDVAAYVRAKMAGVDGQMTGVSILVYKYNTATPTDKTLVWTNAAFGEGIAVEITGTYNPVLPTMAFFKQIVPIMSGSAPMYTRSIMYSEAN
jgi:Flp pilus assembly protein TadG